MLENKTSIPEKQDDVSEKETQFGFGSMKGNSIDAGAADALNNPYNEQKKLFDMLKNYSATKKQSKNTDDPEKRAALLEQLKSRGVDTSKIRSTVTVKQLEILLSLWSQFANGEKPNGKGKIDFNKLEDNTLFTYSYRDGTEHWYFYIWVQKHGTKQEKESDGKSQVKVSGGFKEMNGNTLYDHDRLHPLDGEKISADETIKTEEKGTADPVTPVTTEDENREQAAPGQEIKEETIVENTSVEQTETINGANTVTNEITTEKESGEETETTGESTSEGKQESGEEVGTDTEENPEDILIEEVPTHKFNSSGLKFSRRDGQPLTYGDVSRYIQQQKKLGNKEFIDKFPTHVKGRDPEGTYATFEIADSKYKYYGYSFDPEFGKKEEPEPTSDNYKDFKGEEVNQPGRISATDGLQILKKPNYIDENKTGIVIPYGGSVTVIARSDKYSPGYVYVRDKNGNEGWIQSDWVLTNVKEDSRIYHVKSGDTLEDVILSDPYYAKSFQYETGNDRRTIVMAILLANKGRTGIYLETSEYKPDAASYMLDSGFEENRMVYQTIRIKEGHNIELPSVEQIKQWQDEGKIGTRSDFANFLIEVGRSFEGFIEGVGYGFVMGAADMATGIWDLIESIITGSIIGDIADLIDMLSEMGWMEIFELIGEAILGVSMEDFEKAWNNPNPYKKWHFYGEVVGRIIFEVLIAILTGGGALAGKLGKLGKLNKIVDKMEDAKDIFKNKLGDKVDDLKKGDEAVVVPVIVKNNPNKSIWSSTSKKNSVDNAYSHYEKHGGDFPDVYNAKQYVEKATDFMNNPPSGTLKKIRSNGDEVFYDPKTNTFGVRNANGEPKTFYKPDPSVHGYPTNLDYFNAQ